MEDPENSEMCKGALTRRDFLITSAASAAMSALPGVGKRPSSSCPKSTRTGGFQGFAYGKRKAL